jgi:glycosyl transferase family 25
MNLYHIKKKNDLSIELKQEKQIFIDLENITNLGDLLFIISNGLSLSYEYNMSVNFINNTSSFSLLKYLNSEDLPRIYYTLSEPIEYFYNKLVINNKSHVLIKGKYQSYKYFDKYTNKIKSFLFENINDLIIKSHEQFTKLSGNIKVILVYINKDTLIKESYYNVALNKFFLIKNKDEYKILVFTESIDRINNWTVFKNYNCEYLSGNEEKLFLLMIQCDHFILTNSSLPLIAYYFRNKITATVTFPPIWIDDLFNYNDMIPNDKLHITIINKLNNTHIINLENRKDRKLNSLEELKKISYSPQILKAHENKEGRIGRTFSHIDVLLKATELNMPYIVICEDNIHIDNEHYLLYVINEIMTTLEWDVIILGDYNDNININHYINKIKKVKTTLFYIVNKHYYNKLLDNFLEGKDLLVKDLSKTEYNIGEYWIKLQNDNWYTTNKKYLYQRIDFSDINKDKNKEMKINISFINDKIIPSEYLDDIPIFNLNNIKELSNIHPYFYNYNTIIINIKCIKLNTKLNNFSLNILKDNDYDFIKLQTTYNEKTFNDKIQNDNNITELTNKNINYNYIAFLLNNNSIKKIINKNFNLKMGKIIKPLFFAYTDRLWLDYYNSL